MSVIFRNGNGIIVNARGPGKLHLLSYGSNLQNHVGYIETNASGVTRFVISHSYTFTRFAFYWEGSGEASYGTSFSLVRAPAANSWESATVVVWGSSTFTTGQNVTADVKTAVIRDGLVTAFIIPDL